MIEKEIVLFVPGAGMDHRVSRFNSPNPKFIIKYYQLIYQDMVDRHQLMQKVLRNMQLYFNLLSEIDISGIHLCGHSMGGLVAMELAASNNKF